MALGLMALTQAFRRISGRKPTGGNRESGLKERRVNGFNN